MDNIKRAVLALAMIVLSSGIAAAIGGGMKGDSGSVPRVAYVSPSDGAVLDLTGKEKLVFEWQMVPIPSGGRDSYRFALLKAEGYGEISGQVIDERTFTAEVPADKFEPGTRYRWYVKQRDAKTMVWSLYDTWYFTVSKK